MFILRPPAYRLRLPDRTAGPPYRRVASLASHGRLQAASCGNDAWAVHPSYDVPNFHRITVHGSTFPLEWLKLTISSNGHLPSGPDSFGPFSWQRMPQS